MMNITARDLLHEILEAGDLSYQIYAVNTITDQTINIDSFKIYDDVVEIKILPEMKPAYEKLSQEKLKRDKTINSLKAIKDNIVNGRRAIYGVYEITKDLDAIIDGLKE